LGVGRRNGERGGFGRNARRRRRRKRRRGTGSVEVVHVVVEVDTVRESLEVERSTAC
jgi:hypothetical protein